MAEQAGKSDGMEAERTRFEEWRSSRSRKSPVPDELWTVFIDVARRQGVNRAAQALRLDAGKLKRLLVAADTRRPKAPRQRRFVELIAPAAAVSPECVIEFESATGRSAHSLEDRRCAGLGESAARLASLRAMMQITAQMRALVAMEPVGVSFR